MTIFGWVLVFVAVQRLCELVLAQINTKRLLASGGVEIGARHYPLFILLHASWLVAIAAFVPWHAVPNWWLLGLFALLQLARIWVIATLGRFWTTRVITVPGAPLVRRGPFRLVRHPNYCVVVGEIAVLPLAFGNWWIALVWSLLNATLLSHRIRVENAALNARRSLSEPRASGPAAAAPDLPPR